jgi:hypothetical protein
MIESVEFDDVTKVLAILFGAFVFTMTVLLKTCGGTICPAFKTRQIGFFALLLIWRKLTLNQLPGLSRKRAVVKI